MKFAVIDLEGTTLKPHENECILEIGIVEVNFESKKIKSIFHEVIKEKNFKEAMINSWIFEQNSTLYDEVMSKGVELEEIRVKLQNLLNKYWVTSYNESYDFNFLEIKGFTIPKKLPCMMLQQTSYLEKKNKKKKMKWPTFQKTWDYYFPYIKYQISHRAIDDANHEAKVLIKMVEKDAFPEMYFSSILEQIYSDIFKINQIIRVKKNSYVHNPNNERKALIYLNHKFPLHIIKNQKILQTHQCITRNLINLFIIDIGCGPLTFSQAILEEVHKSELLMKKKKMTIVILGFDKYRYSLDLGYEMILKWKNFLPKDWEVIPKTFKFDFNDDDTIFSHIKNYIDKNKKYSFFIGYSSVFSSGLSEYQFSSLLKSFEKIDSYHSIYCMISESIKNNLIQFSKEFQNRFSDWTLVEKKIETITCVKPKEMEFDCPFLNSQFHYNLILKKPLNEINLKNLQRFNNKDEFIILYNKSKNFQLKQRFVDFTDIKLYDLFFENMFKFYKQKRKIPISSFYQYKIRKGIHPFKFREIVHVPMNNMLFSCAILEKYGYEIDSIFLDTVFGSRISQYPKIHSIYEYYTIGYQKYTKFEINYSCTDGYYKADIKNFYPTINRNLLLEKLKDICVKISLDKTSAKVIIDLLGDNIVGIPIQHPLSPILANCFLRDLDEEFNSSELIMCFGRYMDDYKFKFRSKFNNKDVKSYLEKSFGKYALSLNTTKFKHLKSEQIKNLSNYNQFFIDITKKYFEVLDPIKNGILKFIKINNIHEINHEIEDYLRKLSDELEKIGINWRFYGIRRFFHFALIYLKKNNFMIDIPESFIILPDLSILKNEKELLLNHSKNSKWIEEINNLSIILFHELDNELKKLQPWYGKICCYNDESVPLHDKQTIADNFYEFRESEEFTLIIRKIRFTLYKLIRIKHPNLLKPKNRIIKNLSKFYKICLPLKSIFAILYSYKHITILEDFLLKKIDEKDLSVDFCSESYSKEQELKFFYDDDYAKLLHYISQYYLNYGIPNKISIEMLVNGFNLKTSIKQAAIIGFIINLNLTNDLPINTYLDWIENAQEYFLVKNIIICILIHHDSTFDDETRTKIERKLKKSKYSDEFGIKLLLKNYKEIQEKFRADNNDFDSILMIKKLPEDFNINEEFRYLIETEDSFYQEEDY